MQQPNEEYVHKLLELVNKNSIFQSFSMQLISVTLDHAIVTIAVEEDKLQQLGIGQGGILATLIDAATFWSAFLKLSEDSSLVNIDLNLNYIKTVNTGLLTAEGRCFNSEQSMSYTDANVKDEDGSLLAHGTSTLMAIQGKGIDLGIKKFLN